MANEIVRYNNVVVAINDAKRALVQSASIQGDPGLELLASTTATLPVSGPKEITVEINELATEIKKPNELPLANTTGIVYIGHPDGLKVRGCLLESASYSLNSEGFFTSTLTFKGTSLEGSHEFSGTTDISKTGRAPYRVFFNTSGSSFSSENIESLDINYNIPRSILYSQGNPTGIRVLNYPVETTVDYTIVVSTGNITRLSKYSCDNSADIATTGLDIQIGSATPDTITECYLNSVSYDGAEVGSGPLKMNLSYISHNNYGLVRKITG